MSEPYRYAAFISYSSKDAAFAKKLHGALEGYGIPSALGHFDLLKGSGKKNRIYPVFRDREELAAGDLSERIQSSLSASGSLIVVCSPDAAVSPWVEKEIQSFLALSRRDRIFAIVAEDAPLLDSNGKDATPSCFPLAFRGDALTHADALEPLAADARKSKDGFRNAWLKIVAGMIGVTPGQLIDRDRRRRRRQAAFASAGLLASMAAASVPVAWQDATAWRSSLTAQARILSRTDQWAEALGFAVAGMDGGGAIIPARAKDADDLLRSMTGLPLRVVLPKEATTRYVKGGKMLLAIMPDKTVVLYDLAGENLPRTLGLADGDASIQGGIGGPIYATTGAGDGWLAPPSSDAPIVQLAALEGSSSVQPGGTIDSIWTVAVDDQGVVRFYDPEGQSEWKRTLDKKVTWFEATRAAGNVLAQTESGDLYLLELNEAAAPQKLGKAPPLRRVSLVVGKALCVLGNDNALYLIDLEGKSPVRRLASAVDPSFEFETDDNDTVAVLRLSDGSYASIETATFELSPLKLPAGSALDGVEVQIAPRGGAAVLRDEASGVVWYFSLGSDMVGMRLATVAAESDSDFAVLDRLVIAPGPQANSNYPFAGGEWFSIVGGIPMKRGSIADTITMTKDGKLVATVVNGTLMITAVDASKSPVALGKVGLLYDLYFSPDGKALLSWERSGALRRFDIITGTETRLGTTAPETAVFPSGYGFFRPGADGNWVVIADSEDSVWLMSAVSGASARLIGEEASFGAEFVEGTNIVKIFAQSFDRYIDPVTGNEVAPPAPMVADGSGSARAEQDASGHVIIRQANKASRDLGSFPPLGALLLSDDASTFVGQETAGPLWVVNLSSPEKRRNLEAEHPEYRFAKTSEKEFISPVFKLAANGSALVAQVNGGADTLVASLVHEGSMLVRGRSLQSARFSDNGGAVIFQTYDKPTLGFDLRHAGMSGDPDWICRHSGDALPPFSPALRRAHTETGPRPAEEAAAHEALRGRLWNPCDWRGLLAITPDDRGGGWFEGPRQWFRLIGVRMNVADDYTCEETVGGADQARHDARWRACLAKNAITSADKITLP